VIRSWCSGKASKPHFCFLFCHGAILIAASSYYLTTTTWTNIQITRATTIAGLKTATPTTVWTDSTAVRCCNVWAPEIHRINGRWYIYYTAGATGTAYTTNQKIWVLQGGTDTPMDTYTFLSQMIPPNNNVAILDGVSNLSTTFRPRADRKS
jgi:GH43 family beta-xylosidase